MRKVNDRLKDYAQKCEQGQPVSTLANDLKIEVRYPDGHRVIGKTLRLLQRICE